MSLPLSWLPAFVASVGDAMTNAAVNRMTAVKIPTRPNNARVRVALISDPPRFASAVVFFVVFVKDCAAPRDEWRDIGRCRDCVVAIIGAQFSVVRSSVPGPF